MVKLILQMPVLKIIYPVILFVFISGSIYGQQDTEPVHKYITIIPGEEYKAGSFHRFFFGDQWRDLWTTLTRFEVLNLHTYAGGLKPEKKGGGQQTLSLKLAGRDGNEYRFRSLNKTVNKLLPEQWLETPAEDILQDQVSSSNPVAPIIAAPIISAAGIMHAQPHLYIMPDDSLLGKFKDDFAGKPGTLQIQPDEEDSHPVFSKADKIVSTYDMLKELEKDNSNIINSTEYLKARLIDIFLNDWDRHVGQWNWAMEKSNGVKLWSPIPKDRDQAFARFDGVFPFLATLFIRHIHSFGPDYNDIQSLTYSGRFLDRRFLPALSKSTWDSLALFIKNNITDSVIISAVKKMPPEMFAKEGNNLIKDLRSRRDKIDSAADEFYRLLAEYVTIYLTDENEKAFITRYEDKVNVVIYAASSSAGTPERLLFSRQFNSCETKEIRVLMMGGDDSAVISGKSNNSIDVIISAGEGRNIITDSSIVTGTFAGLIPFNKTASRLFRMNDETIIIPGRSSSVETEDKPYFPSDTAKYEPVLQDYGYKWNWVPWLQINSNEGLLIGGGRTVYKFGYNYKPFEYRISFKVAYATESKRFRADVHAEFYSFSRNFIPSLSFEVTGLNVTHFYGSGNNTPRDLILEDKGHYDIRQQQFILTPHFEMPLTLFSSLAAGTSLEYVQTERPNGSFIASHPAYGSQDIVQHNFFLSFFSDTRNGIVTPSEGHLINAGAYYYPGYFDDNSTFFKIAASAQYYIPLSDYNISSAAFRIGGEKLWGKYPFFESAFIGGQESLRGFKKNRFAGDASFYTGTELRLMLFRFFFIIPVQVGLNGFAEAGRVFKTGEHSDTWHSSYGGGVLFSLVQRDFTFNFSTALSGEDTEYYLTTGFAF